MTEICEKCGKNVDITMWIRVCCKDEQWCIDCIRQKYGCNCGTCEYCIKKRDWQAFQKRWQEKHGK